MDPGFTRLDVARDPDPDPDLPASPRRVDWRFGPLLVEDGVVFRLWAPHAREAALVRPGAQALPMAGEGDGWFSLRVEGIGAGVRYAFSLDGRPPIPDPASAFQPEGVEGPSMVLDHDRFAWRAADWRGRTWPEAVIYELHVGTFTLEGTYRAAIGRLDHLVDLGITAVELMPLHDFPGRWGWGYDGVAMFAPAARYGSPSDLAALVDAAHERGLMVFLDVVYNHFGAQANHLVEAMPVLSERHEAEFGTPPNLDGDMAHGVRQFLVENALHWLVRYRFDGLRLDAAHELHDESEPHFLQVLADTVTRHTAGREVHLVLENSRNQASWLDRDADGRPRAYRAQWSDNIHHALHVALTGERAGFYISFDHPVPQLARALAEGFAFQGEVPVDSDAPLGEPSAHLPPTAFIAYAQNHDQVGNRPGSLRIGREVDLERLEVMASIVLLSPTIPLIFMGEEWNATTPFLYFADLDEPFRQTIRRAREEQMARWGRDMPMLDPFDPAAFERSKLDWTERGQPTHRDVLALYRRLLAIRRRHLTPRLAGIRGFAGRHRLLGARGFLVDWNLADGAVWRMEVHFDGAAQPLHADDRAKLLWAVGAVDGRAAGPAAFVSLIAP